MYICRLFHTDQPFEQIDVRLLESGKLSIGRDSSADWVLDDPSGRLSRIHCTLEVEDAGVTLRDNSTNGTFLCSGERLPHDKRVQLPEREPVRIGGLTLLVDRPKEFLGTPNATMIHLPVSAEPVQLPRDWAEAEPAIKPSVHRDIPLLEAFCEGAKLDASVFVGEDPAELMRRLGAIYQQTVLGLSALMEERVQLKERYDIDRTTIGAVDNNPFKWAPSRRLAQELLCTRDDGFLSDVAAVRASFEDICAHVASTAAGANAALAAVLDALSPETIEQDAAKRGFSLKGRAATCWDIHSRTHAALSGSGDAGKIGDAFRDAYNAPPSTSDEC